ncbi:MAG: PQQ-binding-like beta-propeller repeat protein [Dehalococcoidia bacterium]
MHIFRYKSLLKLSFIILLFGLLLAGCSGITNPNGWAGPVVSDNTLYAVSQKDGELRAVDLSKPNSVPDNLTPRLKEASSNFLGCEGESPKLVAYGTPVVSDGVAYIGAYDGMIYAVNTKTKAGTEAWSRPVETDGPIVANPVIAGTSLIVASGNKLFAINTLNGSFLWGEPFKADGNIWSNPVIYGDKVYFGSLGHKLYSVKLDSGQLYWKKSFDGPVSSTPLIIDNTIYIGTFESKFYALDAETGDPKWEEPFKANDWFWTKAAYKDGTVYVGSLDKNVYAIDAATGKAKWNAPVLTEGPIRAAALIVGDVLLVSCKTNDGFVHGIDLETGQEKWRPIDLGKIYADPWVEGNKVYYLNRNDDIYTLDVQKGTATLLLSLDRK